MQEPSDTCRHRFGTVDRLIVYESNLLNFSLVLMLTTSRHPISSDCGSDKLLALAQKPSQNLHVRVFSLFYDLQSVVLPPYVYHSLHAHTNLPWAQWTLTRVIAIRQDTSCIYRVDMIPDLCMVYYHCLVLTALPWQLTVCTLKTWHRPPVQVPCCRLINRPCQIGSSPIKMGVPMQRRNRRKKDIL